MRLQRLRLFVIPALFLLTIALLPSDAAAQRRGAVVRPAVRPVGRQLIIRGGFYGPVFFNPWYAYGYYGYPWFDGFGYQYGYPYGPYGYYGRMDVLTASVRLEVTPKDTEVYVDGFRAGSVDDYDGFFQRLRLRPGEHELVLYHDGFRTVHQHLYMNSGADQKIRYTMVPLPAGEPQEARPQPPMPMTTGGEPGQPNTVRPRPMGPGRGGPPPMRQPGPGGPGAPEANFGAVSIRVQPGDADVLIDGERWSGSNSQDRLVVQLPVGRHRVEVRKDGFENYSSDVNISRGQTVTLNVSLSRRPN